MPGPYTLTVYTALPGTALLHPKTQEPTGKVSVAGHMWYDIRDGEGNVNSYGFAPKDSGRPSGPGKGYTTDTDSYQNPRYARTLEISAEQYAKLKEFGQAALKGDWTHFKGHYNAATNSCVDFTWGALKHAGMEMRHQVNRSFDGHVLLNHEYTGHIKKGYEGWFKPGHNRVDIDRIVEPVPDSPLNRQHENPVPENRTFMQRLFSENSMEVDVHPTAAQLGQAQQFRAQVGGHLRQFGMSEQQVDALAAAAVKEQARWGMQGDVQAYYLSKDSSTIAMQQQNGPLREFSVVQALGQSEQAHWREAAQLEQRILAAPVWQQYQRLPDMAHAAMKPAEQRGHGRRVMI